jgi:CheY-like chemotaxis protein
MSLVGNLEDLGLGEILQIVSLSRKSGILTLNSRGREGKVVFSRGQVIRATSPTYQEGLGEVLVRKGLMDHGLLRRALSIQKGEGLKERLGTILINYFQIPAATIEEVVREQIENVVYSLFDWTEGTFGFELQDNVEVVDTIEMDPMQFMLEQGLNPQFLAMEGSRLIDEKRRHVGVVQDIKPQSQEIPPPEESIDLAFNLLEPAMLLSSEPPVTETTGKPILVMVDDNAATREALVLSLQENGYAVYPFAGSEDAITKLATLYRVGQRPTALVDLIMPKMDGAGILGGVELLELIKDNFPDIPVLAMADYHNSEAESKVRRMRFPLIMKPRRNEIRDNDLLLTFVKKLLAELARIRSGGGPAGLDDKVNIGDELRLEMGEEPFPSSGPVVQSTGISLLRRMLEELNNPSLGGDIILLVLRFASEFMNRAVIFIVREEEVVGLGQFGVEDNDGSADSTIRNMRMPKRENSLFNQVIETQVSVKINLDDSLWNRYLFGQLGGGAPTEVFVGPIVSEGKVVALLYGDNLPEKKPIGDTDSLEIFLSQAGLAMEKALLQRRLKEKSTEGM